MPAQRAGDAPAGRRPRLSGELIIALGVIALAAIIYWQVLQIPVSPIYAQVGPTMVPMMCALGLGALGAALLVSALRGGWQPPEERGAIPDRAALLWIVAGLLLNVALIGPAGFTLASIVLFVCVARAFGSRALLRDVVIAAVFALVAYFGFAKTLGINIGAGFIERAIETVLGIEAG
jgi:putative tricarboxylic transport membrane protein